VSPHAQPFYCPYCGEEDFVPWGDDAGHFLCKSCGRHYTVKFLGLEASTAGDRE
jgi:transposase-like protein